VSLVNTKKNWNSNYLKQKTISFPAEYVIRIFKGNYPKLHFDKQFLKNKKICDVGCGDGRNMILLQQCGFRVYGTEITEKIVNKTKSTLSNLNIKSDVRIGTNDNIQFGNDFFDFVLSWNACYYMGNGRDFDTHVDELARILKSNGHLILSIPKKTCFIFNDSKKLTNGYRIIKNDPFKIRNNEVLRIFENEKEIVKTFSRHFYNFIFASIHDDCFGFNYHWHIVVCQAKPKKQIHKNPTKPMVKRK